MCTSMRNLSFGMRHSHRQNCTRALAGSLCFSVVVLVLLWTCDDVASTFRDGCSLVTSIDSWAGQSRHAAMPTPSTAKTRGATARTARLERVAAVRARTAAEQGVAEQAAPSAAALAAFAAADNAQAGQAAVQALHASRLAFEGRRLPDAAETAHAAAVLDDSEVERFMREEAGGLCCLHATSRALSHAWHATTLHIPVLCRPMSERNMGVRPAGRPAARHPR